MLALREQEGHSHFVTARRAGMLLPSGISGAGAGRRWGWDGSGRSPGAGGAQRVKEGCSLLRENGSKWRQQLCTDGQGCAGAL